MEEGRIVERGTHAELVARGGRYAEMWQLQQSSSEAVDGLTGRAMARRLRRLVSGKTLVFGQTRGPGQRPLPRISFFVRDEARLELHSNHQEFS